MQIFKGEKRFFDTYIEEEDDSTSNTRHIVIPGISRYSELTGSIIPIKAYIDGASGATTIQVNNLSAVNFKLFYNSNTPVSPQHSWIKAGQVYNIVYTGEYFTAVGILSNSGASVGSVNSYSFDILNDIIDGNVNNGDDITSSVSVDTFNSLKVGDILLITDINNPIDSTAISKNIIYTCEEFENYYRGSQNGAHCTVKTIECFYGSFAICLEGNSVFCGTNPPIPQN